MTRTLGIVALLATLCACGEVTVGAICEKRDDCALGQDCVPSPGGFCSKGCTFQGDITDCPGGTVCTFFGASTLVCSTYCTTSADCRINYECVGVKTRPDGTQVMACRPEPK